MALGVDLQHCGHAQRFERPGTLLVLHLGAKEDDKAHRRQGMMLGLLDLSDDGKRGDRDRLMSKRLAIAKKGDNLIPEGPFFNFT